MKGSVYVKNGTILVLFREALTLLVITHRIKYVRAFYQRIGNASLQVENILNTKPNEFFVNIVNEFNHFCS